jgi:hypothetical protein
MASTIERRPRAPVLRSIALWTIAPSASSAKLSSIHRFAVFRQGGGAPAFDQDVTALGQAENFLRGIKTWGYHLLQNSDLLPRIKD